MKALCALVEKEHRREAELEQELARLQHANMVDEMLELQVTGLFSLDLPFLKQFTDL